MSCQKQITWLILLFFSINYFSYSQINDCLDEKLLKRSFLSLNEDKKFESSHIIDPILYEEVFSIEMVGRLLDIIEETDIPIPCDSVLQISLIFSFQDQHSNEYGYVVVNDKLNTNYYYSYMYPPTSLEAIGVIEGEDQLLNVANQLFTLDSPHYEDYMIVATIEDNAFTSYKATQKFAVLKHYQILVAFEQLIRLINK